MTSLRRIILLDRVATTQTTVSFSSTLLWQRNQQRDSGCVSLGHKRRTTSLRRALTKVAINGGRSPVSSPVAATTPFAIVQSACTEPSRERKRVSHVQAPLRLAHVMEQRGGYHTLAAWLYVELVQNRVPLSRSHRPRPTAQVRAVAQQH